MLLLKISVQTVVFLSLMWPVDDIFVPPVVIALLCRDTISARMVVGHSLFLARLPETHWVTICAIRCLALTVSDVFLRLIWFQSTSTYNTLEVSHSMHHMNSQLTYSLTYLPKLVSISWLRRRAQTCDKVELMRPSDDWPVEDNDEYETEWRLTGRR